MEKSREIGCVIMASGMGKRFGSNKLLADFGGQPMICRIMDTTEKYFVHRVVVTRHEEVKELCEARGIAVILHDFPGRNDTVRLGILALEEKVERCMFCPSDQPLLSGATLEKLIQSSDRDPDLIHRACSREQMGMPVIFPKWTFEELKMLPQGKGGGVLMKKYPDRVTAHQVADPRELRDVDTITDLEELLYGN